MRMNPSWQWCAMLFHAHKPLLASSTEGRWVGSTRKRAVGRHADTLHNIKASVALDTSHVKHGDTLQQDVLEGYAEQGVEGSGPPACQCTLHPVLVLLSPSTCHPTCLCMHQECRSPLMHKPQHKAFTLRHTVIGKQCTVAGTGGMHQLRHQLPEYQDQHKP